MSTWHGFLLFFFHLERIWTWFAISISCQSHVTLDISQDCSASTSCSFKSVSLLNKRKKWYCSPQKSRLLSKTDHKELQLLCLHTDVAYIYIYSLLLYQNNQLLTWLYTMKTLEILSSKLKQTLLPSKYSFRWSIWQTFFDQLCFAGISNEHCRLWTQNGWVFIKRSQQKPRKTPSS